VPFGHADSIAFLASAIMRDEIHHVQFLRTALGSAAVKKPEINLDALGSGTRISCYCHALLKIPA
jgi:hypothetical protein